MTNFFKKYIYYVFYIFLLLLSLRVIFIEAISGKLLGHNWDWTFPANSSLLNIIDSFSRYTWNNFNLGNPSHMTSIHLLPNFFIKFTSYFLDSPWIILLLLILVISVSFHFYKLFLDVFLQQKNTNFIFAIIFSFSPFLFNEIIGGSWYMWISYAATPVYLYFLFSLIFQQKENKKHLYLAIAIAGIFVLASPHNFFLLNLFIFLEFIFLIFSKRISLRMLIFLSKAALLFFVLGMFFILPIIFSFNDIGKNINLEESSLSFSVIKNNNQNIFNIFSLVGYLDRNMYYFSLPLVLQILFYPSIFLVWVIALWHLFKNKKTSNFSIGLGLLSLFLAFIFIIKGGNKPFGNLTMQFFYIISVMKLFRSPQHLMYAASILVPVILATAFGNALENKHLKNIVLVCAFVFISGWWLNGNLGYERLRNDNRDFVDFFTIPNDVGNLYLKNESLKINHRIFFLPSVFSPRYINNEYQGRAQGSIPEYIYFKNPTFVSERNVFANDIDNKFCAHKEFNWINYLSLTNVRYIVPRFDILPVHTECGIYYGWNKNFVVRELDKEKKIELIEKDDHFSQYKLINDRFLAIFYASKKIVISNKNIKALSEIVSSSNYDLRSVIYFENQNKDKKEVLSNLDEEIVGEDSPKVINDVASTRVLEFKKINPTKYRVRVHSASGKFPLVFSESFHDGWKSYLVKRELDSRLRGNDNLSEYKILDGNSDDQATKEELTDFIQKGYVTDIGNGFEKTIEHKKWEDNKEKLDYVEKYNIDFVSKNFQGTIQNDNLPSGKFWETWFKKSLPEENHLMANGYANSWVIDVDSICNPKNNSLNSSGANCVRNADGSYDFELVIEFWPQRLFYIGLFISGSTLALCLAYLIYDWKKRRKMLS